MLTVRDRPLGADASENNVEAIEEVPEAVIEPDQQQDQGKQLRILILANLFWRMNIWYTIIYILL